MNVPNELKASVFINIHSLVHQQKCQNLLWTARPYKVVITRQVRGKSPTMVAV